VLCAAKSTGYFSKELHIDKKLCAYSVYSCMAHC
jgi:hypothetical protein